LKLSDIVHHIELKSETGQKGMDREVRGGYCGDLLSDVMANARKGYLWLTVQSHQNIVAVAVLKELAAIILVNGRMPEDETMKKADAEGIPVLVSPKSAYELAGILHSLGVGGEGN
jgi:predicted transcriptional regulator